MTCFKAVVEVTCVTTEGGFILKKVTAIKAKNTVANKELLKKPRVCAYCRVSTDNSKQMESLETQVSYYENYIKNKSGWEYAGVFKDEGISGTGTAKREDFNKMLKACELGKIDLIITKSISRFSRNTADCLETVRYLKSLKVAVYFERENINTLGADSELILSVLSSLAQDESKNISENIKWAFQKKFKQGKIQINTKRFLGYDVENGMLIINKEEAKIVKRIYKEYLSGSSLSEIKKGLEKDKIKTVTGLDTWQNSTIKKILSNEKYHGDLIQQKTITVDYLTHKRKKNNGEAPKYEIKNHHKGIISKEDFLKVQEIMKKRAAEFGNLPENRNKYTRRYAFSGKIICSNCGAVFKRRTWNSKSKYKQIVWQCSTYINEGKNKCDMKAIDDNTIKAVFVEMFNRLYENKNNFFKAFIDNIDKVLKESAKCENVSKLDKEIDNVNEEIKKLIRQQIKGELQDEVFDIKHKSLNEKLQELKVSKNVVAFDSSKYKEILKRSKEIERIIEMRKSNLIKFDDDIFKNLIEKIMVVTPTHIEFHLKNGMKVEEEFTKK